MDEFIYSGCEWLGTGRRCEGERGVIGVVSGLGGEGEGGRGRSVINMSLPCWIHTPQKA